MSTRWNDAVEAQLNELSLVTPSLREMVESLTHAMDIAEAGGITGERLHAMLHLAGTRSMTPTTERVLADAGIDTTPWAVATGEQKVVPADAIVIERAELPEVTDWDGVPGGIDVCYHHYSPTYLEEYARAAALECLAVAEYLAAHPPVPPVSDEDVETLAGLVDEAGLRVVADASSRLIARRLLATGQVSVTK